MSSVSYALGDNLENLDLTGSNIIGTGNALDNTIYGGSGNTFIYGGEGNDVLNGEAVPVDIIFDTTEENYGDYLDGGVGNDTLTGSGRQDTLYGGKGNDKINGACAKDYLIGGNGNDKLYGGDSSDTLTGGTGANNFGFIFPNEGIDTITDFVVASDTITVDAYGFGGGLTPGAAITPTQFRIGAAAADEARSLYLQQKHGWPVL